MGMMRTALKWFLGFYAAWIVSVALGAIVVYWWRSLMWIVGEG